MELYIYDFDDTLALSDSRVEVRRKGGQLKILNSREFAKYVHEPGDEVDFSQFTRAQGEVIWNVARDFRRNHKDPNKDVFIVTARQHAQPVKEFLERVLQLSGIVVIATSGSAGKVPWLEYQLDLKPYTDVYIYEDCMANLEALSDVIEQYNFELPRTVPPIRSHLYCVLEDKAVVTLENVRRMIRKMILEAHT
jgi:hypothetical protein